MKMYVCQGHEGKWTLLLLVVPAAPAPTNTAATVSSPLLLVLLLSLDHLTFPFICSCCLLSGRVLAQIVHLLCRVIVAAVDACINVIVLGDARSIGIVDMLLFVNQSGSMGSKELVAEVWPRCGIDTEGRGGLYSITSTYHQTILRCASSCQLHGFPRLVAAAKAQSGGAIADGSFFQKCVSVIVRSSAYPAGFVSWAANRTGTCVSRLRWWCLQQWAQRKHCVSLVSATDVDEPEFQRYRSQLCGDALSALAGQLGVAAYLQFLGTLLQQVMAASADWVEIEMVLFAARVVHLEVLQATHHSSRSFLTVSPRRFA
jgi:hypothetical protein